MGNVKEVDEKFILCREWGDKSTKENFTKTEGPFSTKKEADDALSNAVESLKNNFIVCDNPQVFKSSRFEAQPAIKGIKGNRIISENEEEDVNKEKKVVEDKKEGELNTVSIPEEEEESEDEDFVLENEEDEEEEEEEDEEDEEDDDEDEIQDILDDLEEKEGSFIIEDGVNASESSVSLQFMMKLFFQLPEDTRLYLLD